MYIYIYHTIHISYVGMYTIFRLEHHHLVYMYICMYT